MLGKHGVKWYSEDAETMDTLHSRNLNDKHWKSQDDFLLFFLVHPQALARCFHHVHFQAAFFFHSLAVEADAAFQAFLSEPLQLCLSVHTAVAFFITFPVCVLRGAGCRFLSLSELNCLLASVYMWQTPTKILSSLHFRWSEAESSLCSDKVSRSYKTTLGQVINTRQK